MVDVAIAQFAVAVDVELIDAIWDGKNLDGLEQNRFSLARTTDIDCAPQTTILWNLVCTRSALQRLKT